MGCKNQHSIVWSFVKARHGNTTYGIHLSRSEPYADAIVIPDIYLTSSVSQLLRPWTISHDFFGNRTITCILLYIWLDGG